MFGFCQYMFGNDLSTCDFCITGIWRPSCWCVYYVFGFFRTCKL